MINGDLTNITSPLRTITAYVTIKDKEGVSWDDISSNDRLQSIEIDRVGENKFFGFGICQKATIKVIDKEKALEALEKNFTFIIGFNDADNFINFYIDSISRDENTNTVTIVGYDAINLASTHTVAELGVLEYAHIAGFATDCAKLLGLQCLMEETTISKVGINTFNYDGTETLRDALTDIAEATQTVYFIRKDTLIFKKLDIRGDAVTTIDKSQYFTLENKESVTLAGINSVTELGDNLGVVAAAGVEGVVQNIYNNPLLEMWEYQANILEYAMQQLGGLTIWQYNLNWRGNYLLEPCDKINIVTKDNGIITTYLINDTITYNGGYKQVSKWDYAETEKPHTNPTNIGEAIKQTFAKVDKVNKQINLVASEAAETSSKLAALQINTDSINASVSTLEQQIDSVNGNISEINKRVNATMTDEEINIAIESKIASGTNSVTTSTGFTFNDTGLTISKSDSNISTTITEDGMQVEKDGKEVLTANNEGVSAVDLHATTFLLIGVNSRFEDYDNKQRTGCFWIGG